MTIRVLNIIPIAVYDGEVSLGPLYVSSALKQAGFSSFVYSLNLFQELKYFKQRYKWILRQFEEVFETIKPDVITFSVLSTNNQIAEFLAKYIKEKRDVHIVFGGIHAIIDHHNIINKSYIDAVCTFEGEYSLPEYLDRYFNNNLADENDLNITYKKDNQVVKGIATNCFKHLDEYPFPDRSSFFKYYDTGLMTVANVITGRGCPYKCHYCNATMLNDNKGFLRYRTSENVIEEIIQLKNEYHIEKVIFSDETFTLKKNRLHDFLSLYRSKIDLPFVCQTRVECVDPDIAEVLAKSGCVSITMGIESGSEQIRKRHLNRRMSNDKIGSSFSLLKEQGVTVNAFNMIGLPEEKEEDIWEGILLNRSAKVDNAYCTIFMPFKGTKIYDWYSSNETIIGEPGLDYYNDIIIKHPNISSMKLKLYADNYQQLVESTRKSMPLHLVIILVFKYIFKRKAKRILTELFKVIVWMVIKNAKLKFVLKRVYMKIFT